MKNLTLTLEEEIAILDKYKLNSNELMFLRTLLILQDDNDEELFSRYVKVLKDSNINLRQFISTLQDKEVILKSYKIPIEGESYNPYLIPINKNFLKNLYRGSFELGKELFDVYPQFGNINGCVIPLRSIAKKFNSLEDAYFKYGKCIKWNPELHNHIIELVQWAKDNNILNMSLASFIVNNSWLDLEALKNGDAVNVNFDTIKML